ncbi:MBL fold metallo-hydrolase [Bacillus timonensis]|uniref:MBL fold metallo-hydrolase n=1 Tax=Bacillus timonensis TaxID=1033734 RepID=UPI000288F747|nr:MBL fold metallo-hydrolase [Bacillus timonensis]
MGEFHSTHFTLEKVSSYVYAAVAKKGSGSVANAGFVNLGDQLLIFDTFNTQQASADLKKIAEKITNQSVTWVINSHWHGDHIRGNQTFKESKIISSEVTYSKMRGFHPSRISKQKNDLQGLSTYIQSLEKQGNLKLNDQLHFLREIEKSLPTLELVLPNQTFRRNHTFSGTACRAKLFTLGGGHSFCDACLYIPEEKVIFMGDLLFVNGHPTFFEESNPNQWIQILREVERLDFNVAIPGHGSIGTKQDISNLIDYIAEITTVVSENESLEEIEIPSKYKNWGSPEVYHQNIKVLYEMRKS